jgi:hypothetical protein
MNRRLSILIAFVAFGSLGASLSACGEPHCGRGTVQQQQTDGTLKCVAVDVPEQLAPCDVDGGTAVIVGGLCVPVCDPASMIEINGVCVPLVREPLTCRTPSPGHACVMGWILDFTTSQKSTVPIHVELYDPLTLLHGGNPIATYDSPDGSSYVFQDFVAPGFGFIVVTTGRTTPNMTVAGVGAQDVANGNVYRLDAYALPTADANAWGFDLSMGAQVAKFYKDPKPSPTNIIANETMPAAGVTLTKDGNLAAGAAYFNDMLTAVDPTLTVTGSSGAALVAAPIPPAGTFSTFSGVGPTAAPITWEQFSGGSAAGLVLITRFHPNM